MNRKTRSSSKSKRPATARPRPVAPPPGPDETIDLEIACHRCGTPLHVTSEQIATVLLSLKLTGSVWLQCICGQVQLVGYRQTRCQD